MLGADVTDLPFLFDDPASLWDDPGDPITLAIRAESLEILALGDVSTEEAFRLGLYDLLLERGLSALEEETDASRIIAGLISAVSARYAPLRYRFYEQDASLRARKLAGGARDTNASAMKNWLVPNLKRDIAAYRARIASLRSAIDEHTRG